MADITKDTLDALRARLVEVEGYLHIDERRLDVKRLEEQGADPALWNDADAARDVMAQLASAKSDVAAIDGARAKLDDAAAAFELGEEMGDDDLLAEAAESAATLEDELSELELSSWFTDDLDHRDAIVTVTPGRVSWCATRTNGAFTLVKESDKKRAGELLLQKIKSLKVGEDKEEKLADQIHQKFQKEILMKWKLLLMS